MQASATYAASHHALETSLAATIQRTLALRILRGQIPVGAHLAPVRQLAKEFSTTSPTIQRVVDRLATAGLVSSRRGSGVVVNDTRKQFDPWLLPLRLEALGDQPQLAARILGDFLELRRVVTAHLLATRAEAIRAKAPLLAGLVARLPKASSLAELVDIDQGITATVLDGADQTAVSSVFSITERVVRRSPFVAEAFYGDREAYLKTVAAVAVAVAEADRASAGAQMVTALADWDARTLERFEALLRGSNPSPHDSTRPGSA